MSDDPQKKKTRRAARRAAQEEAPKQPRPRDAKDPGKKAAERGSSKTKQGRSSGATTSIRDEGLRAREAAAARRRKKRDRERAQAAAEGLDTGELVDDALARGAHATTRFVQRHFKWLQWLVIAGVGGAFGLLIYNYRVELGNQKGTALLMQGLSAELGHVKDDEDLSGVSGFVDTRPEFDSDAARLAAAKKGYEDAINEDPKAERKVLARLGLAGILFDQQKYKAAEDSYREVRDSSLAGSDPLLKGRAVEGIGLSQEARGERTAAEKTFKELENLGGSFTALAQYHRARLEYGKGNRDKAKELLKKVLDKSTKDEAKDAAPSSPGFVGLAAQQLLEAIDPSAKPQAAGISPEQLKKIQEQLNKAAGVKGGGDANMEELMKAINSSMGKEGAPPPAPTPAPDAPTETETPPTPAAPQKPSPAPPAAPKPAVPPPAAPKPAAPKPAAPKPAAPPPAAPAAPAPAPGTP